MPSPKTIASTVAFTDPQNNVVASGVLILDLSQPSLVSSGGGQVAPKRVAIVLSTGGLVPGATTIWANDQLTPSGTTYHARLFDSNLNLLADFGQWNIAGASPIDLSQITPTSTSTVSNPAPVLLSPAADQHMTGTFNFTVPKFNSIIWLDGTQYTTLAGAYAAVGTSGGVVMVCPNQTDGTYLETLSATLTMNRKNAGFIFTCPAIITMGSNQVVVAASTTGAFIKSWPSGTFNNVAGAGAGVCFKYSGTGTAMLVGTSASSTVFLTLEDIDIDVSTAGTAAVALNLVQVQLSRFVNVQATGLGSGVITQKGFLLDGSGSFCGDNVFINCGPRNFKTAVQLTSTSNLNTFIGGFFASTATTPVGIDIQNGNGNRFVGADIENIATAVNVASNANNFGNRLEIYAQGNTTDVAFGALSFNNYVDSIGNSTGLIVTDAGTNNGWKWLGSNTLLNEQAATGALTGNAADQTVYTYTMPARTMGQGKDVRVRGWFNHTTGTASVTYKVFFGATSYLTNSSTLSGTFYFDIPIFNNAGATNAQHGSSTNNINNTVSVGGNGTSQSFTPLTSAIDTTAAVIIKLTFNVAATDQVTGGQFIVEAIQ